MSVILSAAASLSWLASVSGAASEADLLREVEAADRDPGAIFLPYLSGERTPHNDPLARGVFFGLTHETTRADLGRAVLEGVAFALADGQRALLEAGAKLERVCVIGGGARSLFWGRILASALERPLDYAPGAEVGPAFGAARLARLCATGEDPSAVCTRPPAATTVEPEPALVHRYKEARERYRALYRDLRSHFAERGDRGATS
jgi:xylulokinase